MTKYKIKNGVGIIPNGTTKIAGHAFSRKSQKKSFAINLLSSLSTFFSFSRKSQKKSFAIPNSVTKTGIGAFADCKSLTSITIPNSVTEIGDSAFSGCEALTSITIPNSVTKIGKSAFNGCKALTSITIPNSVTEIGNYAFRGCNALTSINIPESVTEIGVYAFSLCHALTSVTIPNSVTEIGVGAFESCEALTSIIVAEGNKVYDSRGNCNAIIETETNRLIQGCANTVIPESVTEIGDSAFEGCKALTSINIPESVTYIGVGAFESCEALTSIIVAEGNKVYDSRGNCNAIIETETNRLIQGCANTVIPESVTEIGDSAFSECYALTSVTIPNSVTKIGDSAFEDCGLEELILCHTDPTEIWVEEDAFLDAEQCTLYVPEEGVAAFQKDPFWSEYADIKPITDGMLK